MALPPRGMHEGARVTRRPLALLGSLLALLMAIPAPGFAADPQRIERIPIRGRAAPGLEEAIAATRGSRRIEVAVQMRGQTVGARVGERASAGEPLSDAGIAAARRQIRSR